MLAKLITASRDARMRADFRDTYTATQEAITHGVDMFKAREIEHRLDGYMKAHRDKVRSAHVSHEDLRVPLLWFVVDISTAKLRSGQHHIWSGRINDDGRLFERIIDNCADLLVQLKQIDRGRAARMRNAVRTVVRDSR